jgi:PilZ domain
MNTARATVMIVKPAPKVPCRRRRARHQCSRYAEVRVLSSRTEITWPAELRDISEDGCGMVVGQAYRPGALLRVSIFDGSEKRSLSRSAAVCHARRGPDGGWIIGVDFATPLTTEDVVGLLGAASVQAS